jgi:hypothetical protein
MTEGDLPSAIVNAIGISGDVWWSNQKNQEDISSTIATLKEYIKAEYKGENVPKEVILEAFKTAYLVDVDPETNKGEYTNSAVKKAVGVTVQEWLRAKDNLALHTTQSTDTTKLSQTYSDRLTQLKRQITQGKRQAYLGAMTLRETK